MGNYDFDLDLDSINTMSVINKWIKPKTRVLELGAANGRLTKYLSQIKECQVDIVELDEESGLCAEKYANLSYIGANQGDIEKYYWADAENDYDYVVIADVLEHLRNPQLTLIKALSVIKDKGSVLISVPNITHNSVIIELLNDRFYYTKTGLLDSTHIHFFTYKTLKQMISESDGVINEVVPIYSRVGDNEIQNSFESVDGTFERLLRQSDNGGIYQFVCQISHKTDERVLSDIEPIPFEQEQYKQMEALLFYAENRSDSFSDERYIGCLYRDNGEIEVEFNINKKISKLRFCPFNYNGVLVVKEISVLGRKGNKISFMLKSNTEVKKGNSYIYYDEKPLMGINIRKQIVSKVIVKFEVIAYRQTKTELDKYKKLLLGIK